MEQKHNIKGISLLFLTSMIWGASFVAQSAGMDYIGPITFNGLRMVLGAIVLIPFALYQNKKKLSPKNKKYLWRGGILCGIALFIASTIQQIGIVDTTAGKAGFITAMYVVIVPVLGLFLKQHQTKFVWMGVALSVVGMYFLTISEKLSFSYGDMMVLLGAVGFSVHILLIDIYSTKVDSIQLSCIQFSVSGMLGILCMFLFETPQVSQIAAAWLPLLYAGVGSCGIAYTLQILGQKNTNPTLASMILCLEAVFSVLFSWLLLGEKLSVKELFGCALIFAALLLAQIKEKRTETSI